MLAACAALLLASLPPLGALAAGGSSLERALPALGGLGAGLVLAALPIARPAPWTRGALAVGTLIGWLLLCRAHWAGGGRDAVVASRLAAMSLLSLSGGLQVMARVNRGLGPRPAVAGGYLLGGTLAASALASALALIDWAAARNLVAAALAAGDPGASTDVALRVGELYEHARAPLQVALASLLFPVAIGAKLFSSSRPSVERPDASLGPPPIVLALGGLSLLAVLLQRSGALQQEAPAEALPRLLRAALVAGAEQVAREGPTTPACTRLESALRAARKAPVADGVPELEAGSARCIEGRIRALELDTTLAERHERETLLAPYAIAPPRPAPDPSPWASPEPEPFESRASQDVSAVERSPLLRDPAQRARVLAIRKRLAGR
jgi:hypothetical protein